MTTETCIAEYSTVYKSLRYLVIFEAIGDGLGKIFVEYVLADVGVISFLRF